MTTTTDCPGLYHVALDGIGFMLDESDGNPGVIHQSIRTQREQQSGSAANIGESTVNPEGFWRRSRDGWHHGAGQRYADRTESDELRFYDSQGVDVFGTKHQLSLLRDVEEAYTFAVEDGFIMQAGSRIYIREGATIKFVDAPMTTPWTTTTVTGTNINAGGSYNVHGMATDGRNVYIAAGGNGIDITTTASSTATNFVTGSVASVSYVKGRLLTINTTGDALYNPVAAGALPSPLMTLPAGLFWGNSCGGPQYIYTLAGDLSSRTLVYKTAIKADGTALDVPVVAGELATGVVGVEIFSYVGKVFVASVNGVQMASIDGDGNLIFGSTIPGPRGSYAAFCAYDRFVWYGIPDVDGNGLGRMDLTVEILPNTPAYASDIRDPTTTAARRNVSGMVSYGNQRVFVVDHSGGAKAYVESATEYVDSGWVESGLLALDLADAKTAVAVDVEAAYPDDTTITEALSVDRGATFTTVNVFDDTDTAEAPVTGIAASRQFELRTTLTASTDNTETPVLYRHTLKVEPGVSQGLYIILRLRLFENEIGFGGQRTSRSSVASARAQLEAWQATREVIVLQEGSSNYNVTVRDIEWQSEFHAEAPTDGEFQGVMTTRLKVVSDAA